MLARIRQFIGILSLAAGLLLGVGTAVSQARPDTPQNTAYTFTVDFEEDIDDNLINGFCEDYAGRCTLRAAIQEANAQAGLDTILIEPGTYLLTQSGTGEDNADTGDLDITDDVIIQATGPGVYIDGNQIDRVFHIPNTAVTVQIEDVTIRNGLAPDTLSDGGGIYNWGALTLQNVTVFNNRAGQGGSGGGIYTLGPLVLNHSYINLNESGDGADGSSPSGGGSGGGIYAWGYPVTISSTIIHQNSTGQGGAGTSGASGQRGGDGGGLYLGDNTTLSVVDSVIRYNSTGDGGSGENNGGASGNDGGLHFRGGVLTMTQTAVYGNSTGSGGAGVNNDGSAGGCGGVGIWYARGAAAIEKSAIYGNVTGNGRYGGLGGGLCYIEPVSDYLTVNNSTISGNTASSGTTSGGNGGGFYTIVNPGTAVYLYNSTVSDNEAAGSGGGLYYYAFSGTGPLNVRNSIVANNAAASSGPDCYGTLVSQGYNLIENTAACAITGDASGNINGQDPLLGALQDNGGATPTHALLPGSPAIDSGHPTECPPADQRGAGRPHAYTGVARCDMGAFEIQGQESSTVTSLPGGTAVIFGSTLVSMTRQVGSTDPLTTTVAKMDDPPGGGDPDSGEMAVTWAISAVVDSGLDVDAAFCYSDDELSGLTEADLSAYRFDGATWQDMGGTVDEANNCVLVESIAAFSDWTLATETPTMPLPTSGEIQGTVTYTGSDPNAVTIEVALHAALNDPPIVSQDIAAPGGVYSFTAVPNGSYYVSAFIDLNGSGGPPDGDDLLVWYDANGDETPDAVTVAGDVVTDIDLTLDDAPVSSGEIQGVVSYTGPDTETAVIEVGLHPVLYDPPVVSKDIAMPGGVYSFTAVPDGSYYVSALMDVNGSGGPPDDDDLLVWYDANGDDVPDAVTVAGNVVTGIDLALAEDWFVYLPVLVKP